MKFIRLVFVEKGGRGKEGGEERTKERRKED